MLSATIKLPRIPQLHPALSPSLLLQMHLYVPQMGFPIHKRSGLALRHLQKTGKMTNKISGHHHSEAGTATLRKNALTSPFFSHSKQISMALEFSSKEKCHPGSTVVWKATVLHLPFQSGTASRMSYL